MEGKGGVTKEVLNVAMELSADSWGATYSNTGNPPFSNILRIFFEKSSNETDTNLRV